MFGCITIFIKFSKITISLFLKTAQLTSGKFKIGASKEHVEVKIDVLIQHLTHGVHHRRGVPRLEGLAPVREPARVVLGVHQRPLLHFST